jgi:hypothetical protein
MATEEFLELSGAYSFSASNIFPSLEKILKKSPSEIYPTCVTSNLQVFDKMNTKTVTVEELKSIEFSENDDTTYIVESRQLIFLDNAVADVQAVIEAKEVPATIVVMAASSRVRSAVKASISSYKERFNVEAETDELWTNNLYIDGAVAGGTLVGLFLLLVLGIALKALLNLQTADHISDDYKTKDVKKIQ